MKRTYRNDRLLSVARLKEVLAYEPETGIFRWRIKLSARSMPGKVAGTVNRGGRVIAIDGINHRADRLAWLYVKGQWPSRPLVPVNEIADDNRIENLIEDPARGPLTAEYLRSILSYDPLTGVFTWIKRPYGREGGHIRVGDVAGVGTNDSGYHRISIGGKRYRAHRLAWFYMTGEWPQDKIDHRNLVRHDNSFTNLRPATSAQNMRNNPGWKRTKSGFKGVYENQNGRWRAMITIGTFDTKEEAHAAYVEAARRYFGEFARGG